jgi:hypothetical protein
MSSLRDSVPFQWRLPRTERPGLSCCVAPRRVGVPAAAEAGADFADINGIAEEVAEKVGNNAQSLPQALKRGHVLKDLAARVELVPFPRPFELEFFRKL